MKKITIQKGIFHLEEDIQEVIEGIVKPIGNGAMIMSEKKYVGKKVYVLVRKTD